MKERIAVKPKYLNRNNISQEAYKGAMKSHTCLANFMNQHNMHASKLLLAWFGNLTPSARAQKPSATHSTLSQTRRQPLEFAQL